MYMKKQTYMSPMTNLFVVSLEEGILAVSTNGNTIKDALFDEWDDEL